MEIILSEYTEFFLNTSGEIIQFETLEISHPAFTKVYRVVRNASEGINARGEDGLYHTYVYYPMRITSMGARGDLDQGFEITLGELGEVLPKEVDAITSSNSFGIKPIVKYRSFRSDKLDTILFGPIKLEVKSFSFTRESSSFQATAPQLNINKTGELYKLDRFPMLRGFL